MSGLAQSLNMEAIAMVAVLALLTEKVSILIKQLKK
jgi:hypothetical protein